MSFTAAMKSQDAYEVVIAGDGVPVLHLEPAGSPDDAWRLELDLRGADLSMPPREWQPAFEDEDHRPRWQPVFEEEPQRASPPPPPPRPRPLSTSTRERSPRARARSSRSSGATQAASGTDAEDGRDDPDPLPAPAPDSRSLASPLERHASLPTPTPRAHSPWLTSEEAQEYLRFKTPDALYRAVSRGRVPVHRLGRRLLFHRDELDALLLGATKLTPPATISSGVRRHRGGQR